MTLNEGYAYSEQLGPGADGLTALRYLTASYTHSPEHVWRERLERGEVRVDGVVASPELPLHRGQRLVWERPPWEEPQVPLEYEVVYEDAAVLAVVKPSGLPTMPAGGFLNHTLLHQVRLRFPGVSPLHRLGRGTSGLVLFTRTPEAASRLGKALREGRIDKRYRALASGVASRDTYEIDTPIGRVPHPRLGTVHGASPEGKAAFSVASVLERRSGHPDTPRASPAHSASGETLFEVKIETGRPEQIRIHLAAIGHPLVGDPLFAAGGLPRSDDPGLPGDCGYLLHAERLAFEHPETGAALVLRAPPPAEALRVSSSPTPSARAPTR